MMKGCMRGMKIYVGVWRGREKEKEKRIARVKGG